MRKTLLIVLAITTFACQSQTTKTESAVVTPENSVGNSVKEVSLDKMLRHVVLFKFKDESTPEDIKKVEDAFRALPSKIDAIKDFEWGTNNSPENIAQGYTHCFFVTFADEAGRAEYLPHPDHKAFGEVLTPHLDKVLVIDYWAAK